MTSKKNFLLCLTVLIFLATPIIAQETPFLVEIENSTNFPAEGKAVTFEAKIQHPDPNSLEIEWDFGDNSKISGKGKKFLKVRHAFFLQENLSQKFDITLTVKDSEGRTVTVSAWERPQAGDIRIIPVEPATTILKATKGETKNIKIKVVSRRGKPFLFEELNDVYVQASKKKIEFEKTTDPEIFMAKIPISTNNISPLDYLTIYAKSRKPEKTASLEITVNSKPLTLNFFIPTLKEKTFSPQNKVGVLEVTPLYPNEKIAKISVLNALLETSEGEIELTPRKTSNETWEIPIDYTIKKEDTAKGLFLKLSAEDNYGNKGKTNIEIPVVASSNYLKLFIINPEPVNGLELGFGQKTKFVASISSSKGKIKNAGVKLVSKELGIEQKMVYDKETDFYSTEVIIPEKSSGLTGAIFEFVANAEIEKIKATTKKELRANFTDELNLEFIYPKNGANKLIEGYESTIELKITYPDGSEVKNKKFNSLVFIDDKASNVKLEFDSESNSYKGKIPFNLEGEHTIKVKLLNSKTESDQIFAKIEKETGLMPLLILGVSFLVLVIGATTAYLALKKKDVLETKELTAKNAFLENREKELEKLYKQGKITTEEYAKKLLEIKKDKKFAEKQQKEKKDKFKWEIEKKLTEEDREFLKQQGERIDEDEQIKREAERELLKLKEKERIEKLRKEKEEKPLETPKTGLKTETQKPLEKKPGIIERITKMNQVINHEKQAEQEKKQFDEKKDLNEESVKELLTKKPEQKTSEIKRPSLLREYLENTKQEEPEEEKINQEIEKKISELKKMFKE